MAKHTKVNPWIEGTTSDDTMTGAKGQDTFVIREGAGHDTIVNFNAREPDSIPVLPIDYDLGRKRR